MLRGLSLEEMVEPCVRSADGKDFVAGLQRRSAVQLDQPCLIDSKVAGSFGSLLIVRRRGRLTSRSHSTPVLAFATHDGLLFDVLYGATSAWVRNVLATGEVEVKRNRRVRRYAEPRLVGSHEGLPMIPLIVRWRFRMLGVRHFLQVDGSGHEARPTSTL